MPLPDVQTLENNDQVAAQQNPAFMQEPITSPSQVPVPQLDVPGSPSASPIQTGQQAYGRAQNSPFSQSFLNAVYGNGPNTRTPGNLNTIDYNEAKTGTDRYPQFNPEGDNEEVYGLNQSPLKQIANGILKAGIGFVGSFGEGMMSIPDALHAVATGKADALYNDPVSDLTSNWYKSMQNALPNYVTHAQENRNFLLNAVPFSGGSANFWGNTMIANLGPMAGAIASSLAQAAAIGAATEGIGDIPFLTQKFGQASLWLNRAMVGLSNGLTEANSAVDQVAAVSKTAKLLEQATSLGRTGEQIMDLQKIQALSEGTKVINSAQYLLNLYTTARTMSAGGARQQADTMKENLTADYIKKNGYQPVGQDLQKIVDTATAAGNAKFAMDTALMMIQENISLDNILSFGGAAKGKYVSEAQRALGRDLGKVDFKEGTTTLEYQAPTGVFNKIGAFLKPLAPTALSAGLVGGAFYGTELATKNFYQEKYDGKIKGTLNDAINSVGQAMSAQFGTKEGIEQGFVGLLTGALLGLGTKAVERFTLKPQLDAEGKPFTDEAVRNHAMDGMNRETTSGFMKNNFESAAKTLSNSEKMKAANERGDIFEYDNIRHDEFVNFAINHAKNNMPEIGEAKLRQLKELSPDKFTEQFKMEDTPENRKITSDYVDGLITEYRNIIKSRDLISDTFRNPYDPREKAEKGVSKNRYDVFENWKDTLTNYASVARNVADRVAKIQKSSSDLYSLATPDDLRTLTNPAKLRVYNDSLKAEARNLSKSLEADTTTNRANDREKLNYLNKLTGKVDEVLAKHNPDNIHQVYSDMGDLQTFQDLLNHRAGGGDPNYVADLEVPKESLAHLAGYGGDLNKLDILKQQADHAYDILSTEKGFKNFYDAEVGRFKKAAAEEPKPAAAPTGGIGTQSTPGAAPTTPENEIVVIHPTSREQKIFKPGEEAYVPQKTGNPIKVTVNGLDRNGDVNVTYKDGTQGVMSATSFFKSKTTTTKTTVKTKPADQSPKPSSPPPAGTPPETPVTPKASAPTGDKIPDVKLIASGTTPLYKTPDLPDNNYHRRFQSFMDNLGSSDPKVFNPEHRGNMYIQYVTPKTQEALGFKKDWIKSTGGDDNTIRLVHIIKDASGTYYTTQDGNKGKEVGKPGMTGDEAIYSQARTSEVTNDKGQTRYTDKTGELETAVKQWEAHRQYILSQTDPKEFIPQKFTVSRGVEDKNPGTKNSVVKVGLITEAELNKPIISIPTNEEVFIEPLEDDSIGATRVGIPIPNGKSFLNHGLRLTFLNNFNLDPKQAETVVDLLKFNSDADKAESDKDTALTSIKDRVYTLLGDSKVERKPNTLAIQDGKLWLGQDPTPIEYNPEAIEDNKARILDFLQKKAFNNVDNQQIKKLARMAKDNDPEALIYREYEVKDGKLEVAKEWPTYNHYLLSDEGGRTPILSTNLAVPQNGEPLFKNKYPTLSDFEFKPSPQPSKVVIAAEQPSVRPIRRKYAETPEGEANSLRFYEYTPTLNKEGQEVSVDTTKPFGYRIGSEDAPLTTPQNPANVEKYINSFIEKEAITQDETNTPADDLDFLTDKSIIPDKEPEYSYTNVLPNQYEKIDLDKEIANIRADLGEDFPIHTLDHVIKVTNGGFAYGAFYNNAIFIWKDAVKGTAYHEAFEKVFNQFLTGKEQADLIYEFQNRAGEFTTYKGEKKKFEDATAREAKEKIADEFAEFRAGKEDVTPKQKSFFRRLIDFIKKIIFGTTEKINDLFDRMYRKEYRNFSSKGEDDATRPAQYKEDDGLSGFSDPVVQDVMQGMTVKMMNLIYGEGRDLLQAMGTGGKIGARDIYTALLNDMRYYYKDPKSTLMDMYRQKTLAAQAAGDTSAVQQIRADAIAIRAQWDSVEKNWPSFVEKHKATLRPLNIKFSVDEEGNETLDDLEDFVEEDERNPNEYMRDDLQFDSKKSAAAPIKLTFSTVPLSERTPKGDLIAKIDNSLAKLPKLASYSSLYNYTLFQAANVNGLFDIHNKLADVAMGNKAVDPNLQRVLNRLQFKDGFEGKSLADVRFALQFESAFFLNKPDFARQYVENGKTHFYNATLNNKAEQQATTWLANMKTAKGVKAVNNKYVFKTPDLKSEHLDFARTLGINFPNKLFGKLSPGVQKLVKEHIGAIRSQIVKLANQGTQFGFVSGETIDIKTRLNNLADLYAAFVTGDDTQSQHLNLDNKATSSFIRNNALSLILNDANNSKTIKDFVIKQPAFDPQTGDIFRRDSYVIHNMMFDKDGKFLRPVSLTVLEGRQESGKSLATSKLTLNERVLYEFNNNLMGAYYTLVPADGKNEYGSNPGRFISPSAFFDNPGSAWAKYYNVMMGYLNTEIALAKDFEASPERYNLVNLQKKLPNGRAKGASLRFFMDILPKDIVDDIHKRVVDGKEGLGAVATPDAINAFLKKFITDKAKATLNSLVKGQVFEYNSENKTFVLNGVDYDFLKTYLWKGTTDKRHYSASEALDLATYREMNYVIGGIEQHKLYVGDPAQYDGDELKRNKSFLGGVEPIHVDNETGEKGLNGRLDSLLNLAHGKIKLEAKDPGFTPFKNYANVLTVNDIKVESDSMPLLNKTLGESIAKPYANTDEADASVIHHPVHYREVMHKSGGRFPDNQEADWQRHFAQTRIDKAAAGKYTYTNPELEKADRDVLNEKPFPNFDVTYPVLKLKAAGSSFTNGVSVEHINKAAWAMQFRPWVKGRQHEDIYDAMEAAGIDYILVKSAHKIGTSNDSLINLYNPDGTPNVEGIKKAQVQQIPHTTLGIQVEQQTKENKVTQGSQLRSLATQDFYSDGVPQDFIDNNKGDVQNAKLNWDKLKTENEREAASPVHKMVNEHKKALEQLIVKKTELMMKKLGFEEDEAGNILIPDKSRVGKYVRTEVTRRDLAENIKKGLTIDPETGEFTTPLESNIRYKAIRDIVYSVMDKAVIRPKMHGGQLTHQAPTGWETGPRNVHENGKLASSHLPFYKPGEDGTTDHAGFLIPNLFGKEVRDKLQKTHNFKSEEELNDHLFKHLMKTEAGRELLSMIGFRIPTQGANSVEIGQSKGFLSTQMGQRVIGPSELTTKAGLDFDVDKMNVYLKNFWVDEEGYPHKIRFEKLDTDNEQALKDYYARVYSGDRKLWEAHQKDISNFIDQTLDEALDEDSEPDYVPTEAEFLASAKGKDPYQYNSVKALENNYMDKIEALMRHPLKFKALVTPNDASEMKSLSKKIVDLLHPEGLESKGIYGSILDSLYMARKRDAFINAKGGIGVAAVSNTGHALAQLGPVLYIGNLDIKFPHNEIDGNISLSSVRAKDGSSISNTISQTIDGFVDVSKDEFLAEMGINMNTAKNWLLLVRAGVNKETAALFMNQPAVLKYLELEGIHKNVSNINKSVKPMSQTKLFGEVALYFGGRVYRPTWAKSPKNVKSSQYSKEKMIEAMRNYNSGKTLSSDQNKLQLQMLDDYLKYDGAAWDLFRFQQGFNWATDRGASANMNRRKELQYEKAQDLPIVNVDKLLKNTYVGVFKDQLLRLDDGLKQVFPIQRGAADIELSKYAKQVMGIRGINKFDFPKILDNIELLMLDHVIQGNTNVQGSPLYTYIQPIMIGPNSIARYMIELQDHPDPKISENAFIKNIRIHVDAREGYPDSIELLEKPRDSYTSNNLTSALKDLRDDHGAIVSVNGISKSAAQIYKGLIYAAILQSGTRTNARSFTDLIPNEDYGPIVAGATDQIQSGVKNFYENGTAFRNLWADDKLVPIVPKVFRDDERDPSKSIEVSNEFKNKAFREMLNTENPVSLMQLPWFSYRDKPYVKTVEKAKRTSTGDFTDEVVRLYRRVNVGEEAAVILKKGVNEFGKKTEEKMVLYTEVNKKGSRNLVEMGDSNESILPTNPKVEELSDEDVLRAVKDANVPNLIPEGYGDLIQGAEDTLESGEEVGEDPGPSPDDIIKNLEDNGTIKRDCE